MTDGRIVAFGLTKVFGQTTAVDHLSFAVRPGRVTAILGPQRSGRTTILRHLLNLEQPTAGCIMIDGFAYPDQPDPSAAVGPALEAMVEMDPPDNMTAADRVDAYAQRRCRHRRTPVLPASESPELVQLNAVDQPTGAGLAADEWRRLRMAAALVPDPRFLVLDEPDRGLNAVGLRWMQALVGHLTAAGHTIVFVSRTPSHVRLLADDVVEIVAGSLGTTQQFASRADRRGGIGWPPPPRPPIARS